jgi:hypothetical protein
MSVFLHIFSPGAIEWNNTPGQHYHVLPLLDFPTLLHVYIFSCTLLPGKSVLKDHVKNYVITFLYFDTQELALNMTRFFFLKWDKLVKNKLILEKFLQYNLQSVVWTCNNHYISRFSLPVQHSVMSNVVWCVLYQSLGHFFCSDFDSGLLRLPVLTIRFTVRMRDEQRILARLSYRHLILLLIYIKEQLPVFV